MALCYPQSIGTTENTVSAELQPKISAVRGNVDPRLTAAAAVLLHWLFSTMSEPVQNEAEQVVNDVA